jgi:hypothetical protein
MRCLALLVGDGGHTYFKRTDFNSLDFHGVSYKPSHRMIFSFILTINTYEYVCASALNVTVSVLHTQLPLVHKIYISLAILICPVLQSLIYHPTTVSFLRPATGILVGTTFPCFFYTSLWKETQEFIYMNGSLCSISFCNILTFSKEKAG